MIGYWRTHHRFSKSLLRMLSVWSFSGHAWKVNVVEFEKVNNVVFCILVKRGCSFVIDAVGFLLYLIRDQRMLQVVAGCCTPCIQACLKSSNSSESNCSMHERYENIYWPYDRSLQHCSIYLACTASSTSHMYSQQTSLHVDLYIELFVSKCSGNFTVSLILLRACCCVCDGFSETLRENTLIDMSSELEILCCVICESLQRRYAGEERVSRSVGYQHDRGHNPTSFAYRRCNTFIVRTTPFDRNLPENEATKCRDVSFYLF